MHTINIREFQHNMTKYIDLAQTNPILVTKYGKKAAVILNPDTYTSSKKKQQLNVKKILTHPFIGLHQDKEEWKGKKSSHIAKSLQHHAWYGT